MAHAVLAHMMMWGGEWERRSPRRAPRLPQSNSAFVISMLVWYSGSAAIARKHSRVAAGNACQPTHPLIWLWSIWRAVLQFFSAISSLRCRHAPSCSPASELCSPYEYVAASLAYRGQLDEAREALERVPQSAEQIQRGSKGRPGCGPRIMRYGSKVSTLQPRAGLSARRDPDHL